MATDTLRPSSSIHAGKDREKKIGHRRVDHHTGMVTYKKVDIGGHYILYIMTMVYNNHNNVKIAIYMYMSCGG